MEIFKKSLGLLLVFSMTVQSFTPAYAIVDPETGEEEPIPQNPPGTPSGIICTQLDQKPNLLTGGVCCVGLELNSAGKCDEPVFEDPALTSCTSNNQCSGGTGCFPQSANDLFSTLSPNADDDKRLDVMSQLDEVTNPKAPGATCEHARECASYSCVAGKCEDKRVCRFADEGEVAGAGVKCGENMIPNMSGVCQLSPEAKNTAYIGLLKEAKISTGGQCDFELDEETRQRSLVAMRSLRAMEWFFSTLSIPQQDECFDVLPTMKEQIGKKFLDTRKNILSNFTDVNNRIEFDFNQLVSAKQDGTQTLSIHDGEQIAEGDLATRQTSGYDNLMMLYRRNLLFQSYEKAMLETVKTANASLAPMAQRLAALKSGDSLPNCEGSKYKKKKFLGSWKTKYYDKVRDHWAVHYEVTGNAAGNADIVKRENVANVLALIGNKSSAAEAISEYTKPKYYLMDPMLFSGMVHSGETKALKKKSSFLGLFGGFKDLRKAWYIKGSGSGSFTKMHNDLKPKLREFYKQLKTNKTQRGFIYEPELLTTEAKDCLDNPDKPEKCKDFEPFMDKVLDETFAHFLAWSYSTKDSYDGYFENAQTYRRKLLAKLEVDMQNISLYYETVINHRNQQNACIEKIVNGLVDSGILAGGPGGLQEGGVYYKPGAGQVGDVNGANTALKTQKLSPLTRGKFAFDLRTGNLKSLGDKSMMDSVLGIGTTGSRAGVNDSASALLAARNKAMKDANDKASKSGVDIASKEKAVAELTDELTKGSKNSFAGAGSSGGAGSGSAGFGSGNAGSASLGKDLMNGGGNDPGTGVGIKGNDAGAGSGAGANSAGALAGIDSGSGSGYGQGSSTGTGSEDPNAKDGTGLTDAERERMLAEAERNKNDYKGSEEDGIFSKVSKAYVRNLEKVLIKKKKID